MHEKQIRLVVTLHPKGGILLSCTDLNKRPKSYSTGGVTTVEHLLGAFVELGLKKEAERLKEQKWPKGIPVEMDFIIPETEEVIKRLALESQ